jgi:hypothetical protein
MADCGREGPTAHPAFSPDLEGRQHQPVWWPSLLAFQPSRVRGDPRSVTPPCRSAPALHGSKLSGVIAVFSFSSISAS